jgi:ligand-binding sensor domain-containing protein
VRPALAGLVLGLFLGTGCRAPTEDVAESPGPETSSRVLQPPVLDPGTLNQVAAVAVGERTLFLAGEAGIVRLDPVSGAYSLLPEADGASSSGAAALALADDGTLWSAHRSDPVRAAIPRGGVRVLAPGQARPRAYLAKDGIGVADVAALALSPERVVVASGESLAQLRLDGSDEGFVRFFEESNRKLEVIAFDEEGSFRRRVIEFRPRGERVLALALAEPALWVGTTHGLYRLSGDELLRYEIPCRVDGFPPRRVNALASTPTGVIAALGLDTEEGEWRPGGLLELDGDAGWRCHVPDLDVPDVPSLAVAQADGVTWLATYEGPTRIDGPDAELFDAAAGAPDLPASAIAVASDGSVWVGTWGGGVWRLDGESWTAYRLDGELGGTAAISRGRLLSD